MRNQKSTTPAPEPSPTARSAPPTAIPAQDKSAAALASRREAHFFFRVVPLLRFALAVFTVSLAGRAWAEDHVLEERPIFFSDAAPNDPVTRLAQRAAANEVNFVGSDLNVLRAVLRELKIPIQSQIVVFSRTSLQARIIRPNNPRAMYFSENAYVGWVPGGLIEITAIDPELGPISYAFDAREAREARPAFVRDVSCVGCHGGSSTDGNPGRLFAHSLFTAITGEPLLRSTGITITEQTPFARRWGGWYVTGYTGTEPHRGNVFSRERDGRIDFTPTDARPMELSRYFTTSRYLAPTSDVVALLVFEHQLSMHNSFARAAHRVRLLAKESPASAASPELLAGAVEDVVDHLLFRSAAPLPDGVEGSDGFREAFLRGAQRDARGRSLKDFSLQGRLFANRCSFLIYTEAFTALNATLKNLILDRLHAALSETDPNSRYAYIEAEEKQRIREILADTHPDFRARFAGSP